MFLSQDISDWFDSLSCLQALHGSNLKNPLLVMVIEFYMEAASNRGQWLLIRTNLVSLTVLKNNRHLLKNNILCNMATLLPCQQSTLISNNSRGPPPHWSNIWTIIL